MTIEKNISFLIENQFPGIFKEDGQNLVQFLTHYFKWAESNQLIAYANLESRVIVESANAVVRGVNTYFSNSFSNGESIAIYRNDDSYDIFTIDTVDTDLQLTLTNAVSFSNTSTIAANTYNYYNTVYHLRRMGEYRDIDTTPEDMINLFKEQYLKGIQFEIASNKRLLVKRSLDLYRSKGTERSIDLLFRLVYGTGAAVYSPAKDLFKTSSGKWIIPKYLELTPLPFNVDLVGRQVVGSTSGATAFIEEVIRRSVNGVILDIAYISIVKGNFIAGELIDTEDSLLLKDGLRSYLLGSLNELVIDINGSGSNLAIGDIVTIVSQNGFGTEAKGRVAETIGVSGLVDFEFINGGYGYSNAAEVIVSERILEISETNVNLTINDVSSFFNTFEEVRQPKANIVFGDSNNAIVIGDVISTYYANNDLAGQGVVLSIDYAANAGDMVVAETVNTLRPVSEPNANQTGNVYYQANSYVVVSQLIGANQTGNVFVTTRTTNVIGIDGDTLFDQEFVTTGANLGNVSIISGNLTVTSSVINLQTIDTNSYITVFGNSTVTETRLVTNVINSSTLTVLAPFSVTNATANAARAIADEYVAAFTNSTFYEIKQVNAIVNSTYLSVATKFKKSNIATKIAITTEGTTAFILPGANQTGDVSFTFGRKLVTGTGTDFLDEFNAGDWIVLHANTTVTQFNQINSITNATSLMLTYAARYTNTAAKMALTAENPEVIYGKILSFHSNSTVAESSQVNVVTNAIYLTVQTKFLNNNLSTRYANSDVDYAIYTAANAVTANSEAYTSETVTANVVGTKDLVRIVGLATNNALTRGDQVIQYNGANVIGIATVNAVSFSGNSVALDLIDIDGRFKPGLNLASNGNLFFSSVNVVTVYVGVNNVNGTFTALTNNFFKSNYSNTTGEISSVSSGSGATFEIVPDLLYGEHHDINTDYLIDYLDVGLGDFSFGFANLEINLTTGTLADALTIVNTEFGKISGITAVNPGTDYTSSPIVLIYEAMPYTLKNKGITNIYLSNVVGDYLVGELVNQGTGRALVKTYGQITDISELPNTVPNTVTHFMTAERLRIKDEDYLVETVNATTTLIGASTGAYANIDYIVEDTLSEFIGLNAEIDAEVVAVEGAAVNVVVVDSGFGFVNNETVNFILGNTIGTGVAVVASHGTGTGYYRDRNGFLSSTKKLHDGYYYQQYSYDIQSSISRDKYEDIVNMTTHVAGTKMFSTFVTTSLDTVTLNSYFSLATE